MSKIVNFAFKEPRSLCSYLIHLSSSEILTHNQDQMIKIGGDEIRKEIKESR